MCLPWKFRSSLSKKSKLFFARLGLLAATLFLSFSLSSCYISRLALQHNNLFNSRRPVAEVLQDVETDPLVKEQLKEVKNILSFANDEGLYVAGAYDYFIEVPGNVVSYLLQASHSDRFVKKTWWFPVVGSVPYLGFYSKKERDLASLQLNLEGLDVYESGVGAFSSLGWFDDPIYSPMLKRSKSSLATLLFHELTHRSVWIKGEGDFNEPLACFVADSLTTKYLKQNGEKKDLQLFRAIGEDRAKFLKWLTSLKADLEKLYSQRGFLDKKHLLQEKKRIFSFYLGKRRQAFRVIDFIGSGAWNNARILSENLYSPNLERFQNAYKCSGVATMGSFLKKIKDLSGNYESPFEALDGFCLNRNKS